jgi:hypothetical protein
MHGATRDFVSTVELPGETSSFEPEYAEAMFLGSIAGHSQGVEGSVSPLLPPLGRLASSSGGQEWDMAALPARLKTSLAGQGWMVLLVCDAGMGKSRMATERSTAQRCDFRRQEDYWTLTYGGMACHLKDAKGLHYLAALLREPGRALHVAELAALTTARPAHPAAASYARLSTAHLAAQHLHVTRGGDSGARLDAQARAAYTSRLAELQDDLAEAERFNDPVRTATVQAEIDFLTHELAAAYGLSGRLRKDGDNSERLRKTVTNCLRNSLAKIRQAHPMLGQHLCAAVKTGTFCSYQPEQPMAWAV